jgi:hypothetical protein
MFVPIAFFKFSYKQCHEKLITKQVSEASVAGMMHLGFFFNDYILFVLGTERRH